MKNEDIEKLSQQIIREVGGKENIKQILHCATRLRLNLKDFNNVDLNHIKNLDGTLGAVRVGDQLQIIIGGKVVEVYDEVNKLAGKIENTPENSPITFRSIGYKILDALSGTMGPVIPAIVACAFFKMFVAILGPDMLNMLSPNSDIYVLLNFVGDSAFYFFPCIVGYTAAKKFKVTPTLGILMGAILIHPTLISIVTKGKPFSVFGIPMYLSNYSSSIIPIILSVWVMSYVERFFNSKIPSSIRSVFSPAFTILVMLPISLCLLAPAGAFLGNYVVKGLFSLQNMVGFLGIAVIAALYPILVMTGMHMLLIVTLFQIFATKGFDGFSAPALCYASFSVMGVGIGAFFKLKDKNQKSLAASYALTAILAGTSEPTLYGICTRYKKPFIGLMLGGFVGGIYGGLTHVITATLVPSSNVTALFGFLGRSSANIVNGTVASIISLIVAAVVTYFWGFDKDCPDIQEEH